MNNRLLIVATLSLGALVVVLVAAIGGGAWWVLAFLLLALLVLAVWDMTQKRHAILRNFPVLGHMRYLLESIRPEIQQYFIERNFDGKPFDRDTRSIVYARSKGLDSHKASAPSGTPRRSATSSCCTPPPRSIRRRSPRRCGSAARTAGGPWTSR